MKARLAVLVIHLIPIKNRLTRRVSHGMQGRAAGLAGLAGPDKRLFDNQGDGACPSDDVRR